MAQVIYSGGFDAVEVPAFDLSVTKGIAVDVTDEQAEALCVSDDWSVVSPTKPPAAPVAPVVPPVVIAPAAPTTDGATS